MTMLSAQVSCGFKNFVKLGPGYKNSKSLSTGIYFLAGSEPLNFTATLKGLLVTNYLIL